MLSWKHLFSRSTLRNTDTEYRHSFMIAPGTTLQGRYIIERVIGQGGMSSVYLARQVALNHRPVAIKHMNMPQATASDTQKAAEQFQAEAGTLASLRHPNLVAVHDFFSEGSDYYLVMEYVEGTTLDTVVEKEGCIDLPRVLAWGRELCSVLDFLHRHMPPVIFRDLKPSNIILDRIGHVRLIDFGIAKSFQLQSATSTFIIGAGTPGYAPPEQYGTSDIDARTDIYALGATLYTFLTGHAPVDAIDRVLGRATLPPPSRLNPAVPAALEAVVARMMDLAPEQRYATVADAAEALATVAPAIEGAAVSVRDSGAVAPPEDADNRFTGWISMALVMVLLAGFIGLVVKGVQLEQRSNQAEQTSLPPPPSAQPSSSVASSPTPLTTPSATVAATAKTASPSPRVGSSFSPPGNLSNADITTTGSGLMYQDTRAGYGPVPVPGDTVEVQYTVWLMNGTKIDSSLDRPLPFKFVVGAGQVVKGWDEGMVTMHLGGKRKLILPAALAYGDSGAPPLIPPRATLLIDVELIGVQPQLATAGPSTRPSTEPASTPTTRPSSETGRESPAPSASPMTATSSPSAVPSASPSSSASGSPLPSTSSSPATSPVRP